MIVSRRALVRFRDGRERVVVLFDPPERGKELVGEIEAGLVAQQVHFREGQHGGKEFTYEVVVERRDDADAGGG